MIERFVEARRSMLQLWKAKRELVLLAHSQLPEKHNVHKAIYKLCCALSQVQLLADNSACEYANRFGDDLFCQEVDGVYLPAVTHWFYNLSVANGSAQKLGDSQLLLDEVGQRAQEFTQCVAELPFASKKNLALETRKFERSLAKARAQLDQYHHEIQI